MGKWIQTSLIVSMVALAGCASINAQDVQKFGNATQTLASAVQKAPAVRARLADEISVNEQAMLFEQKAKYIYPIDVIDTLPLDAPWAYRIAFAKGLADYGAALVAAVSAVGGDDLDKAVDGLGQAVGTASPSLVKKAGYASIEQAIAAAAKYAVVQGEYSRIRREIARADPLIQTGAKLLAADFGDLSNDARHNYQDWLRDKRDILRETQRDSHGTVAGRYATYRRFTQDQRDLLQTLDLLVPTPVSGQPGYAAALTAMVQAHHKLLASERDPHALDEFAKQVEALANALTSDK
jgi:hypothetical protein